MSDLFGASGQAILQAMILDQQTDPGKLAELAKGSLQKKKEEIIAALKGHRLPSAHRLLRKQGMEHLALLVQQIEELDDQIEEKIRVEGWRVPHYESAEYSGPEGNGGFRDSSRSRSPGDRFPQCGASELVGWGLSRK